MLASTAPFNQCARAQTSNLPPMPELPELQAHAERLDQRYAGAPLSPHTRIVSIGPITSEALREHGLRPHVEASRHDIEGVLQALLDDAQELNA